MQVQTNKKEKFPSFLLKYNAKQHKFQYILFKTIARSIIFIPSRYIIKENIEAKGYFFRYNRKHDIAIQSTLHINSPLDSPPFIDKDIIT